MIGAKKEGGLAPPSKAIERKIRAIWSGRPNLGKELVDLAAQLFRLMR